MRRRAPVCSHLNYAAVVSGRANHSPAFVDSVTNGLLDVDVGSGFDSGNCDKWVPVVRCRHDDDLGALALEHLSIVFVSFRLVATELLDLSSGGVQLVLVDVTHRNNTRLSGLNRGPENVHAPPPRAYQGGVVLLILRPEQRPAIKTQAGRHGAFDKVSSITFHDCVPRYSF